MGGGMASFSSSVADKVLCKKVKSFKQPFQIELTTVPYFGLD